MDPHSIEEVRPTGTINLTMPWDWNSTNPRIYHHKLTQRKHLIQHLVLIPHLYPCLHPPCFYPTNLHPPSLEPQSLDPTSFNSIKSQPSMSPSYKSQLSKFTFQSPHFHPGTYPPNAGSHQISTLKRCIEPPLPMEFISVDREWQESRAPPLNLKT